MSIARSTALVTGITFSGYAFGLVVQIVFAGAFGADADTDAWFAAVAVPNFLAAALFASLAKAVLPVFVSSRATDPDAAFRTVAATANLTLLTLLLVATGVAAGADGIARLLFPSFDAGRVMRAAELLRIAIWAVPAVGTALVLASVLQGLRRFGLAAFSMALQPVGVLAGLLLLRESMGVASMAVGLVAGAWLQLLTLLPPYLRSARHRPTLGIGDSGLRTILSRTAPLVVAAALLVVYPLLEKSFGSRLPPGEISWIGYGRRPLSLLIFLLAGPVSITSFTVFAELAAKGDLERLRSMAWRTATSLVLVLVPAVAFLAVHAESVLGVLYERSAFGPEDTGAAASALMLLLPLAILASAGKVLVHVFLARGRTLVPLLAALAGVAAYVAAAPAATERYGFRGLAGLQTIAVGISIAIATAVLLKSLGRPKGEGLLLSMLQILVAGAATAAALLATRAMIPGRHEPALIRAAVLLVTALAAGGVYLGVLAVFRNRTLAALIRGLTSASPSSRD
jgi:putative peptidoglycan lipid II flippase